MPGISAPTSAGKSFIICYHFIKFIHEHKCSGIYIVPNISLINQVTKDLIAIISKFKIKNIEIHQSYKETGNRNSKIFILTQERALNLLHAEKSKELNIQYAIFDEVQNIERATFEDNERADDLLSTLYYVNELLNPQKIVLSGPRISKIDELITALYNNGEAVDVETTPVVNLTYSFSYEEGNFHLNLYSTIFKKPRNIRLDRNELLNDRLFGKIKNNDETFKFIGHLTKQLSNEPLIIFASTKDTSVNYAKKIKSNIDANSELIDYVSESVHPEYDLATYLKNGVAYHNANVPQHIRNAIELAYKQNKINVLVTTTTLIQGVNLPAKYLIARNPNLTNSRRDGLKLSSYEFANLRGRAGRLMSDFIGRAITIDHQSFVDEQIELFEFPSKEVKTTYQQRFIDNEDEILSSLEENKSLSDTSNVNDLIVFVRNHIYRNGIESLNTFIRHGMNITKDQINDIMKDLKGLTLPKKFCVLFPHWDVFVLNDIYVNRKNFVPISSDPFDKEFKTGLVDYIEKMKGIAPFYYNKYLKKDIHNESWQFDKLANLAVDWIRETPLHSILKNRIKNHDSEKITTHLEYINKLVCYQIPKLIKPVLSMNNQEKNAVSFMEQGAYCENSKNLIDLGIPRDIAIKINQEYNIGFLSKDLIGKLEKNASFNYWEVEQIKPFMR